MERLLTFSFYFTPRPDPNFQHTKGVVILLAILFLTSVGLKIVRRRMLKDEIWKKIIRRPADKLFTFALILLLLLIFRETGMPYLSMRIWGILWAITFLYSLIKFLATFKRDYARRAAQKTHHHEKLRYFSKK